MLRFKLGCKLLLVSFAALLFIACSQKTELQKAEDAAILFYQTLAKGEQEKAIAMIGFAEEVKAEDKAIFDAKLQAHVIEVIKKVRDEHKGIKNITVIESKFTDNDETKAEVKLKIEFNDDTSDNESVSLFKKDKQWLIIFGAF